MTSLLRGIGFFRYGNCAKQIRLLKCRNATDLAAIALCYAVLRGCLRRLSMLAKDGIQETDCRSFPPCATFSAACKHRRINAMWPSASRIALFQYTVSLCRPNGIHSPASGFGGHAAGAHNVQAQLIWPTGWKPMTAGLVGSKLRGDLFQPLTQRTI